MSSIISVIEQYTSLFFLDDISAFNLIALFVMLLLFFILKRFTYIYFYLLLLLPGTFMHEILHYLVSLLTLGRPISFSVWPKKVNDYYVLGSVTSQNVRWYNAALISLAPLLLYPTAWYLLLLLPNYSNLYYGPLLYLIATLVNAGTPSRTDWLVALKHSWFIIVIGITIFLEFKFRFLSGMVD
jgi:hypothetical protein